VEFAARIRTQFRERKPQEELKTMLKYAMQRERFADIALESLSETQLFGYLTPKLRTVLLTFRSLRSP